MSDIYRAKENFVTTLKSGEIIGVQKGDLAHRDSEMYRDRKDLFEPAEHIVRFDVEQATAAPGEKRGEQPGPDPEDKPKSKSKASKK